MDRGGALVWDWSIRPVTRCCEVKGEKKNIESVSSPFRAAAAASENLQLYNNGEFIGCPLMGRRVRFVFLNHVVMNAKFSNIFMKKSD